MRDDCDGIVSKQVFEGGLCNKSTRRTRVAEVGISNTNGVV